MSGRSVTSSKTVEAPRVCVITVAGVITDPDFYAAQELAEALASNFFPVSSDVRPMVESELQHFASTSASTVEGIDTGASVVVFYNDRHLIGDAKAFELWAQRAYQFGTTPDRAAHAATAAAAFQRWAAGRAILLGADGARTIADRFVYMDVAIEGATLRYEGIFRCDAEHNARAAIDYCAQWLDLDSVLPPMVPPAPPMMMDSFDDDDAEMQEEEEVEENGEEESPLARDGAERELFDAL